MLSNLDIHQRIFFFIHSLTRHLFWNHMTELGINFQASYIPKMGSSHNVVQKKDFFFFYVVELGMTFQATYVPKMGSNHNIVQFFFECSNFCQN